MNGLTRIKALDLRPVLSSPPMNVIRWDWPKAPVIHETHTYLIMNSMKIDIRGWAERNLTWGLTATPSIGKVIR